MAEKSRTEHSIQNASVAMVVKIISLLLAFAARVVFTHTLSEAYVGVNGLFMDILNVLSLTELGVGTAITFALYKPIAEQDTEKQKALMQLFRSFYRIIAAVVLVLGLCVVPFLRYLIKDKTDIPYLRTAYVLYLLNTASSYLLIYKRTIIDAHQNSYLSTGINLGFLSLQYVLQIILLLLTQNFILYAVCGIVCTVAGNVLISMKADRMYPYLKEQKVTPLSRVERGEIIKNIRAMMMHKVGEVIVNNTDHLILSSFVGLLSVGSYSNYFLIIGSVRQVFQQMFSGINASIGNLGVLEGKEEIKERFQQLFFVGEWLYGFAAICLLELLSPFIEVSFGSQYVFSGGIVLILTVNFYVTGMRRAVLSFRDSLGLFWYDRYKSLVEGVINLVVSIVLVLRFGTIGVFLGTLISTMLTSFWVEPLVLYKYRLKEPLGNYFLRYLGYAAVTLAAGLLTYGICGLFQGSGLILFFKRLPVCLLVPNAVFLLCFRRTKEFTALWKIVEHYILRKK